LWEASLSKKIMEESLNVDNRNQNVIKKLTDLLSLDNLFSLGFTKPDLPVLILRMFQPAARVRVEQVRPANRPPIVRRSAWFVRVGEYQFFTWLIIDRFQHKVAVSSKYDRQTDRRNFGERRRMFDVVRPSFENAPCLGCTVVRCRERKMGLFWCF